MKKILTLALSICAILSLSACDGNGYSEEEKEKNEYYQYIESTVEAHNFYSTTSTDTKIATEEVNDALIGGDGLFNDYDYMALRFYRNTGTVLNSITFTISSKKDVMFYYIGLMGKQEIIKKDYSTTTTLIENSQQELSLYADTPLTITLYMDECTTDSSSALSKSQSYKTLPSGFSRENRAFILYFIPYEPGTSNWLSSTEKITPFEFGIRFSNISFDFELEE